ncbi:MAG: shikimate dehydrogenase [Kiritimatiellae bacterium]|nr:shikimate dehydrogenase [Kiritimatiellia bacterium]
MSATDRDTNAHGLARYAVLGHPVGHSLSPRMHAANFAALGMKATYEAFDVPEASLADRLAQCRQDGFTGLNLTIPLKARALTLVDEAAPDARMLGGVNTILFGGAGRMAGYNTDGFGFVTSLSEAGLPSLKGLRVLILGCGGTGRALALTCAQAGVAQVLLANRTAARALEVAEAVRAAFPDVSVQALASGTDAWRAASLQSDLVVHTTSQGLNAGDVALLPSDAFRAGQTLFDAVYTAQRTPIMRAALTGGAAAINGLGMLLHQGAQSFRIWTGREPALAAMKAALGPSPRVMPT